MLVTANKSFECNLEGFERLLKLGIFANFARLNLPLPIGTSDDKPLQAEVNHGRWIVKCECGGADLAWEEGLFMCQSCWNGKHKHQYRKAVFPRWRQQIEELLSRRPLENRNWAPGETLAQLKRENQEHKEELL